MICYSQERDFLRVFSLFRLQKEKNFFSFSSVYEISQISSFTSGKNNGNPSACNLVDLQHSRLEIITIPMVKQ